MSYIRANRLELALVSCVITSAALGFFLFGGMHGLYADDYVYRYFGSDLVKAAWTPQLGNVNYRVLAIWLAPLVARWLGELEAPIRLGLIGLHLLNVWALAWLAERLTGSRRVALVAGGAFLIPLFAYEPLLWFSAGMFYLLPQFLLLAGFHLVLSCHSSRQFILVCGAIAAWVTMLGFIESGLLIPMLTPLMMALLRRRGQRVDWRAAAFALVVTYAIALAYVFLNLRASPIVAVHGNVTLDPLVILSERLPQVSASVASYLEESLPRGIFADALLLGIQAWLTSLWFWVLVMILGAGVIVAARETTKQWDDQRADNAFALIAIGLAWFALALVPVLFISGLSVSSRVMLFPSAGLALAAGGLAGWLVERAWTRRRLVWNAIVVALIFLVLVNALAMAGLLRVYQLRSARDQQQLIALLKALPELPPTRVWILAHALDQIIVQPELGRATPLDHLLYGLFDTPWAADRALWQAYGNEKIVTVDKDEHGKSHVVGVELDATGEQVKAIVFQGTIQIQTVPGARLYAFTYGCISLWGRVWA